MNTARDESHSDTKIKRKRVGVAADHGGFELKEQLVGRLCNAGHEVIDFGDYRPEPMIITELENKETGT